MFFLFIFLDIILLAKHSIKKQRLSYQQIKHNIKPIHNQQSNYSDINFALIQHNYSNIKSL
uniref:Uncharacterized protein n=1 Tax=Solanum lycopersicum TaxID=4081 RepID=K4DGN3_SOLLC